MEEMLQNFNFNRDFYEAAKALGEREGQRLVWAMLAYVYEGSQPDLKGATQACFLMAKGRLDAAIGNARKGKKNEAEKPEKKIPPKNFSADLCKETSDEKTGEKPRQKEKEKEYKKELTSVSSKKAPAKSQKTFQPPTVEEVEAYARSKLPNTFNAQKFCDYYTANGWRVGRNPMKDWQAAARNWAARDACENKKDGDLFDDPELRRLAEALSD